jgi:hypothetical protein
MLKDKSSASPAGPGASEAVLLEHRGGSGSKSRRPMQRDIGFIGLGHMARRWPQISPPPDGG